MLNFKTINEKTLHLFSKKKSKEIKTLAKEAEKANKNSKETFNKQLKFFLSLMKRSNGYSKNSSVSMNSNESGKICKSAMQSISGF